MKIVLIIVFTVINKIIAFFIIFNNSVKIVKLRSNMVIKNKLRFFKKFIILIIIKLRLKTYKKN